MKRRSGWIAVALLGAGLLFVAGQSIRAESDEPVASESESVEPLEQAAEDAGEQAKEKAKAGKQKGDRDRGAAARERKAQRKKARADEKAAARKGGEAREHRSERAAERANSQWQEGAARGQDRAGAVRDAGEEPPESDLGELDAEAGGAARETPEQDSRARRGKGEPPEQAKGFWGRLFGSGGDDQE
jgi:hypothetical protein